MSSGLTRSNRRRFRGRTAAAAGMLLAVGLIAVTPLTATAASIPYNKNLVQNAGAENKLGHWDTFPSGDFKTHKYGPSGLGFPSASTANSIGGGKRFFYAGLYDEDNGTCADAQQEWKLGSIGSAIDSGHVKAQLKGYEGTNGAAYINAHLDLYFRNASNHQVAKNGITKKVSSTNEAYVHVNKSKVLPKHTRILRVHLWADGDSTVDGDCQAFWDKISVVLTYV
jgi:hypothetical protein